MLVKNIHKTTSFVAGDLTHLKEILHPANDPIPIKYSLAYASLPVGQASLPHQLDASEVYVLLKGRGSLVVDGARQRLEQGDVAYVAAGAKQHLINEGSEELVFLCIVEPAWTAAGERIL